LAVLLRAFDRVGGAFEIFENPSCVGFESAILNQIIFSLPKLKEPMRELIGDINLTKAAEGNKAKLWTNPSKYPEIDEIEMVCSFVSMIVLLT
jgi:DNA mismatch repair protein MSH3